MTVSTLITSAREYAAEIVDTGVAAMDDAISTVLAIGYTIPNFTPVVLPNVPPSSITTTAPTFDIINLELPTEPTTAPVFQDISDIEVGVLPELTVVAPTIALPTKPSQVAEFLETMPGINTDLVFPEPPDALLNPLIDSPVLLDRAEPDKPTLSLPGFEAVAPTDMPAAPTDYEARFAASYRDAAPSTMAMINGYVDAELTRINPQFHTQMAAIEAQLSTYLAGGTGLNPAVENAIYERARSKNNAEARRVQDQVWAEAAERGFTMPGGSQMSSILRARQGAADLNAAAAREIVVMQAEYEQKNLQFAVTQSASLRGVVLNAMLSYMQNLVSINGQALDYAKTVLSAIIEMYNTAVKAFGLRLDAYKSEVVVYEARLKAALSYLDLYQREINALQALTNMDQAKVDIYKAKIDALTSFANIYRAQIEAVQGRVSLEKLQLDVFEAKVQAYTAQVQGKNAEWQGYAAAIEGETARARIFNIQVDAYTAQLTGYKTQIEAGVARVRAQASTNEARAANYTATLSGYTSVVEARGTKAKIELENQTQKMVAFKAQVDALVANATVQNTYYKTISDVAISNAELSLKAQIETGNATRAFGDTVARLSTANATILGNSAQAAMSGMNTLASENKNE